MGYSSKEFCQNEGIGGFIDGNYAHFATQPTYTNWTRQSNNLGPKALNIVKQIVLPQYSYNDSLIVGKDGIMYLSSKEGYLLAISSEGNKIWEYKARNPLCDPIIAENDIIYVATQGDWGSQGHILLAVSNSGKLLWECKIDYSALFSPVLDKEGNILLTTRSATLFSIKRDGTINWKGKGASEYWSTAILTKSNKICIGCGDRNLYILDTFGKENYKFFVGHGRAQYAPVVDNNEVLYLNAYHNGKGKLISLDLESKAIKEYAPDKGDVWTSPALGKNSVLYIGLSLFRLAAIKTDFTQLWEITLKGFPVCPPIISSDGIIYYATFNSINDVDKSWITAVDNDGKLLWEYEMPGCCSYPTLIKDRILCIRSNNTLYYLGDTTM